MKIVHFAIAALFLAAPKVYSQQEGPIPTQSIITVDTKNPPKLDAQNVIIKVNRRATTLSSLVPVSPSGTQIALLIDDGLRTSIGRQLSDLKSFIQTLPSAAEIFVGYMQNGHVVSARPFTTDHAAAANDVRLPLGSPGQSASPYFCLSDFIKNWPRSNEGDASAPVAAKARFVIMLTNGVDPYNGSVSPLNQNSPYVDSAIADAQRAGVPVYSIYYGDAGIRGGAASFSGQSYLSEVAEGTGGRAYYQGTGNPVSLSPFLDQFRTAIAESYIATYSVAGTRLVDLEVSTNLPKTKLRAPRAVRPGLRLGPS